MSSSNQKKFSSFTISEIYEMFKNKQLIVNESYQRSEVWKIKQKQELIDSIIKDYPIGTLVIWKNDKNEKEILDGQQRLKTLIDFIDEKKDVTTLAGKKFNSLSKGTKSEFEAYRVPYLKLDQELDDDQVTSIFIKLQEGTPLNTPEKVYAFRGNFRDAWYNAYLNNHEIFFSKLNPKKLKRFKDRFLTAQFLLLEMKSRFKKKDFPSLTYPDFKETNDDYKTKPILNKITERLNHNIRFLGTFLHNRLWAFDVRDLVAIYVLQSYFKQSKVIEQGDSIIFRDFVMDFMHDLRKVKLYKDTPPKGMEKKLWRRLYRYKQFGRQATSSESMEVRFDVLLKEYARRVGKILTKDKKRFYETEQRISLFFKQKGICPHCNNDLDYNSITVHHKKMHTKGGKTVIENGKLLHLKCHKEIHTVK